MFSVEKILSFFKYEDPESISGLTFPISEEELSRVLSSEFIPNNERTEEYDIKRMKYFVENPQEIKDIVLEYDGDSLVINDGNHRFMAALYLKKEYISGELIGYLDILPKIVK